MKMLYAYGKSVTPIRTWKRSQRSRASAKGELRVVERSIRMLHSVVRDAVRRSTMTCAGYLVHPFSKEAVFTLECRRRDPAFPAFLPGSGSLQEGLGCPVHDGFSTCSPSAIRLVSRCVLSSPAMLRVWQRGRVPCRHHATPGVLPPQPPCLLGRTAVGMTLHICKETLPLVAPSIGCVGDPFLNRAGKHDAPTHHDRLDSGASYCRCTFGAARMMRRIVSCETPYAAATVRSGSFRSTTRCTTVGQCSAGMPYFGCFGPGRRCLIRGGLLL
jgi:hypothetical protein